jgi:DNA-binding XRE family transcriptional regulator
MYYNGSMKTKKWTPDEIRGFRKSRGLFQKELAKMLGVTERYVIYLEKGVKMPGMTLRLLLDCLEGQGNEKGKGRR